MQNYDRISAKDLQCCKNKKDLLNKERTKVKPVDAVPQVTDNNKNQLKPNISPMKPIKLGNIEANVHENKKIYINENQLNLLNENIDK